MNTNPTVERQERTSPPCPVAMVNIYFSIVCGACYFRVMAC